MEEKRGNKEKRKVEDCERGKGKKGRRYEKKMYDKGGWKWREEG